MKVLTVHAILIFFLIATITAGCGGDGSQTPASAGSATGGSTQNDTGSPDDTTVSSTDTGNSSGPGETGVSPAVPEMLAWDAPAYEDGTPMDGVAGYKIYYGTAPGAYTGSSDVGNVTSVPVAAVSSAVPAPGVYFLVVTAYDAEGSESAYSNEINKNF